MTDIYVPSTRGIVKQLLRLASDPDNHSFIFKEAGCVSGLVSYLKNKDEDIVCMASQALQFLSVNRSNRPNILKYPDVIPSLTSLTTSINSKIRDFASASLSNLNAYSDTAKKLSEMTAAAAELSAKAEVENRRSSVTSSGIKKKTIESFVLAVEGLKDPMVHASVERALIMEKGVTSVTLDKSRSQATIFGSSIININHLVSAVAGVGVKCDTWENKRKANPLAAPPGYLDQDTTEFQKKVAVTSYGFASLEARLNKKATLKEKSKRSTKIISKLGGALSAAKNWFW
jgi:hypothetical protein